MASNFSIDGSLIVTGSVVQGTAAPVLSGEKNTAITTAGAGTLTAAALLGGVITRTGPTAAYTDTTDTAALIIAALPALVPVGASIMVTIKNTVAFPATVAGGTSVTVSGQSIIPPNSVGTFLLTYATATTVTVVGISMVSMSTKALEISTALTTVGAGTILAAAIAGGVTNRTGSTAAYTDTTDTAALIIAAQPNVNIGDSWEYTYYNNTLGTATLSGGTGVTVSLITLVPGNMWARYLVTYTAAATVTMVGIASGPCVALPASQYVTGALQSATFAAGQLTGANVVHYDNTGTTPATLTTRTATLMFGDIPNAQIGFTYLLFIRNSSGSANTATIAGGVGVTVTGTATIAQTVTRMFNVTFPSATTCTIQSMGIFAAGA